MNGLLFMRDSVGKCGVHDRMTQMVNYIFHQQKNVKFCEVLGKQNYRHNAGWKLSSLI